MWGLPEPVGVLEQPVGWVAHEELARVDIAVPDGLARHSLWPRAVSGEPGSGSGKAGSATQASGV
eukprot:scaffold2866_cov148-Isochrysis_galbana.AAC.6